MYTYKMVQIPPDLLIKDKRNKHTIAAEYLQNTVNQYAYEGWEFQRVDSIGVGVKPGCLAALFGAKENYQYFYVITFRKPIDASKV